MDRRLFGHLATLVTHFTIDLISPELDLAKKWVEKFNLGFDEHELPPRRRMYKRLQSSYALWFTLSMLVIFMCTTGHTNCPIFNSSPMVF